MNKWIDAVKHLSKKQRKDTETASTQCALVRS